MTRSDDSVQSWIGVLASIPLIAVTVFYIRTQLLILTGHQDTSVNIVQDTHAPFQKFDFTTGEVTLKENYDFRYAFTVYDFATLSFPADLEKIGTLKAMHRGFKYDAVALTVAQWDNPLGYHACTREELRAFGPNMLAYFKEEQHDWVFCFDRGQDLSIWYNGNADR